MGTRIHFYGSAHETAYTPTFFVSNSHHPETTFAPTHTHEFGCLHFTTSGVYEEQIEQKRFEVERGKILYKPPGIDHCNEFRLAGGASICRIELHRSALGDLALPDRPMQIENPRLANVFYRIEHEMKNADDLSSLSIEGLSWDVVCEIIRDARSLTSPGPVSIAEEAAEMIRAQFPTPPLINNLAEQLGIHRSQLSRTFKRHFGISISGYVRNLRIEKAMDLLRNSDLSLSLISLECGFVDQSHFTRTFRAVTSTTPAKWRS